MGNVTGPTSSVVGHIATWANSTGTSITDGGPIPVDWVNVLKYGADNSGTTDSTKQIATAISNIPANGGVLYFPSGTYLASTISVTTPNITVRGDGIFATTLSPMSTTGNFLVFSSGHGSLENFAIFTNSVKRTSGDTIFIGSGGISISNIQIYGQGSNGFYNGIHFDTATASLFSLDNFLIGQCSNAAIQIGDASSTSQVVSGNITNGNIGSCGNGVLIYQTGGMNVSDLDIIKSFQNGIAVYPSAGQRPFALYFTNVLCDTCNADGWLIGSNGGTVGDVNLTGCWGSSNGGIGLNLAAGSSAASAVNGILVSGGNFIGNQSHGIVLSNCTDVILSGVQVYNNSQSGPGNAGGITVAQNVSGFQIVNCISGNGGYTQQQNYPANQSYGITVLPGSSNNYIIQSNRTPGNISGGIFDGGTGTAKFVTGNLSS